MEYQTLHIKLLGAGKDGKSHLPYLTKIWFSEREAEMLISSLLPLSVSFPHA